MGTRRSDPARAALAALVALAAVGVAWGGAALVGELTFRAGLDRARALAKVGRFAEAKARLVALPDRRRSDPEAVDLLGACEHASGRYEAALAAWSLIPPGSPPGPRAALARARTLVGNLGRFAEAEPVLEAALRVAPPGPDRLAIRHTLWQLCFREARAEDLRSLIRDGRDDWLDPAAELRDLWQVDDATVMIDVARAEVDDAARKAPDDDRVWLARAGLDAVSGRLDDAVRLLDACARRRPDDPAVWLAKLRLARLADDDSGARLALARLPAGSLRESDLLDLRAWLASKAGDPDDQRRSLERRVGLEPADPGVFESLAALAWQAGRRDEAERLRRDKADLGAAKERYRRLLLDRPPTSGFEELGSLAETLNRPFEARGWWSLAARKSPGSPAVVAALARLEKRTGAGAPPGPGTLADRMAALLPAGRATVAGAQPAGPVARAVDFVDDAEAAGLRFRLDNGRSPERQLPETTAGGVGLLDFDGDGRLDVYAVQGGRFPPDPARPNDGDRLFRNRGDGTFEDATARAGLGAMPRGYGHGVAVGDFDNDGRPDLFVTRWRSYALYRNRGDGTFEDATARAGLGGDRDWPTSAAFADLDNDGDLDLYVCHYLAWDAEHPTLCPRTTPPRSRPDPEVRHGYCMPNPFPARPDHLFRNDGGRFVDVTAEAGIVDKDGRGLGVVAADVDEDGLVDLFVANDTSANYLFRNLGGLKFEEVGPSSGVACNAAGAFQAGMGVACGDLDGDGRFDLLVTNFYGESTTFFRNLGGGMFNDQTSSIGLAAPTRPLLGFGITLLDADDDGRLDLAQANGHVVEERGSFPYAMPTLLLLGGPDGRLFDATRTSGRPWTDPRVGRALASGDLDGDGRVDLLLLPQDGPLAYFRNRTEGGHRLTFQLEGTASNRDGVGAIVSVSAGGRRRRAGRFGGGSFQSAGGPRLHFGLGTAGVADLVEVRWPSGRVDKFAGLPADRTYRLVEGGPKPVPMPGP